MKLVAWNTDGIAFAREGDQFFGKPHGRNEWNPVPEWLVASVVTTGSADVVPDPNQVEGSPEETLAHLRRLQDEAARGEPPIRHAELAYGLGRWCAFGDEEAYAAKIVDPTLRAEFLRGVAEWRRQVADRSRT